MRCLETLKALFARVRDEMPLKKRRLKIGAPTNFKKETVILPGISADDIAVLREKAAATRLGVHSSAPLRAPTTSTPRGPDGLRSSPPRPRRPTLNLQTGGHTIQTSSTGPANGRSSRTPSSASSVPSSASRATSSASRSPPPRRSISSTATGVRMSSGMSSGIGMGGMNGLGSPLSPPPPRSPRSSLARESGMGAGDDGMMSPTASSNLGPAVRKVTFV